MENGRSPSRMLEEEVTKGPRTKKACHVPVMWRPFPRPTFKPLHSRNSTKKRTSIHQVQAFPHAKCTADLPLPAACHFLSRYGANQGSSICKKSGQPQFRSSWHRGTSTGRFPSPSQGKLCSCLVYCQGSTGVSCLSH